MFMHDPAGAGSVLLTMNRAQANSLIGITACCVGMLCAPTARATQPLMKVTKTVVNKSQTNAPVLRGHLKILAPRVKIPVKSPAVAFKTGNHIPLFQENDEFFIAQIRMPDGSQRLCAFPLKTNYGRPAWISSEHELFFAFETVSVDGSLQLRQGDVVPVYGETDTDYRTLLERFGRRAVVLVPKSTPDIQFVKVAPPPPKKPKPVIVAPPPPPPVVEESPVEEPPPPEPPGLMDRVRALIARFTSKPEPPPEEPAPAPESAAAPAPPSPAKPTSTSAPPAAPAATSAAPAALVSTAAAPPAAQAPEPEAPAPPPPAPGWGTYQAALLIGLTLVIFVVGFIAERRMKARRRAKFLSKLGTTPSSPEADVEAVPPPVPSSGTDFSGSLSSMSLASVTQFLNSDHETGTLIVTDSSHGDVGTIVFIKGEIIDARCKGKRGVDAVYQILQQKEGFFSFARGEPSEAVRTVEENTITVLLNAHKLIDEGTSPGVPPPEE